MGFKSFGCCLNLAMLKSLTAKVLLLVYFALVSTAASGNVQGLKFFSDISDRTVSVHPKGNKTKVSVLSDAQLKILFNEISALPLPYFYLGDCCQDRSLYISKWAEDRGIKVVKIFVIGDFNPPPHPLGTPGVWNFHVANAVLSEKGEYMVLDYPTVDRPTTIEDWIKSFSKVAPSKKTEIYIKERFAYIPTDIDRTLTEWNGSDQVSKLSMMGCEVVESRIRATLAKKYSSKNIKLDEKLSGLDILWSQKMVGADLSKEFLRSTYTDKVQGIIWDYGFSLDLYKPFIGRGYLDQTMVPGEHGTKVVSLLSPSGDQSLTEVHSMYQIADVGYSEQAYTLAEQNIRASDRLRPLNLSMAWARYYDYIDRALRGAIKKNTLIIHAAGNEFPNDFSTVEEYSHPKELLVVGSITPDGFISSFSKLRRNTFIFAPSDFSQVAKNSKMEYDTFGFTSGAAPMMTAAVANILSVLPGLKTDQVKELLRRSSIKMKFFTKGDSWLTEGGSILNMYKAVRVADRIATKFKERKSIENKNFLSLEIENEANYNFKSEILKNWSEIKNQLSAEFPGCVISKAASQVTLTEKNELLIKKSRGMFLLNPEDPFLNRLMSCLEFSVGRRKESSFYANRLKSSFDLSKDILLLANGKGSQNKFVIRNINFLTDEDFRTLLSPQFKLTQDEKFLAISLREGVDLDFALIFFKSLSLPEKIKFLRMSSINRQLSLRLHELSYRENNPSLVMESLEILRYFPQSEAEVIFSDILSHSNIMLKRKMVNYRVYLTSKARNAFEENVRAGKEEELKEMMDSEG